MFFNSTKLILIFWILSLAVGIYSCQPKVLNNLTQLEQVNDIKAKPLIDISMGEEKTFRAKVSGFDQEMSGLLVVKKLDKEYRFVMVTDFGLKVFDLSLKSNAEYEFHHIMKHMDYEFLKNSLTLDMLMLLPIELNEEAEFYQKDDFVVYTPQKKMLYFVKDDKIHQVQRFRRKRNNWAEAKWTEKSIDIHQKKPEIHIQLKPL